MSEIAIVGGIYHERCLWPDWDQIYGSGGRAAAALSGHVSSVTLHGYVSDETAKAFEPYRSMYGFNLSGTAASQTVSFEYVHSLSTPQIRPTPERIRRHAAIQISEPVVLQFGMMEGSAVVHAERCVYDPQSAFSPEPFYGNGSSAKHLAIVGNRGEITALGDNNDPITAATALLKGGAEVVVIKGGSAGADVVVPTASVHVPAYQSARVWTLGSGDVFASIFTLTWGVNGFEPVEAARVASLAVAAYAETMALPIPSIDDLRKSARPEAAPAGGRAYLASPFFTIGERWVVDEARRCLEEIGVSVFSPVHEIGSGPAEEVAPADLRAVGECDVVFAVVDGLDGGTLFEIGYARALNKPVYALAQSASDADLKMVQGSGCRIYEDFVTALHHLAWRV